jgi:hypothetical protein
MKTSTIDLLAGERARLVRQRPEAAQPIPDPTDPRCGGFAPDVPEQSGPPRRIVDPTNPECGN